MGKANGPDRADCSALACTCVISFIGAFLDLIALFQRSRSFRHPFELLALFTRFSLAVFRLVCYFSVVDKRRKAEKTLR